MAARGLRRESGNAEKKLAKTAPQKKRNGGRTSKPREREGEKYENGEETWTTDGETGGTAPSFVSGLCFGTDRLASMSRGAFLFVSVLAQKAYFSLVSREGRRAASRRRGREIDCRRLVLSASILGHRRGNVS